MGTKAKSTSRVASILGLGAVAVTGSLSLSVNAADEFAGLEEVLVTAEKKSSTIQETAISMSAFDGESLDMRQIVNTSDLQFSVPNMTFGKTNFSGSNIAIRGVGNLAVAASSDAGVGVHVNDVYLNAPRIFEAEFYDMERIEVLRGPQGTLYGRNTTGGVVNLITAKADSEFAADVSVEIGDYNTRKIKAMVNVPLTDDLATRFAVYAVERDGYTDNIYTGNDIDDRDIWSARWSTSYQIGDSTTANLMVSYFEEDDARSRVSKQLCTKDDRGALGLGCLPGSKGYSTPDDQSTIGTALVDLLTAQAIYQENKTGSTNLPKFSDNVGLDSGALLTFNYALGPLLKGGLMAAGVPEAAIDAQFADFVANGFSGGAADSFENSVNPNDLRKVSADFDPEYYTDELIVNFELRHDFENYSLVSISAYHEVDYDGKTDYDWSVPSVTFNDGVTETFDVDGQSITSDFNRGVDRSTTESEQYSQQFRLTSDYDGDFNFTVGAYYMHYEVETHYNVYSTGLTSWAKAGGANSLIETLFGIPAAPLSANQSNYDNNTLYEVDTWAVFGEGYYDLSENTKLTVGVRYSDETKKNESKLFYVDLAASDAAPFSYQENDWQEVTGKIGIDHSMELSFTDDTMLYATVAKGYKGGGFNPPQTVEGAFPDAFDPEYITSLEIGAKNIMMDNRLQANISVFTYDFEGLQVSQIVNQTSVNENVDATIEGIEAEFMFAPNDKWLFGFNLAYLNAEIDDFVTIDTANPQQGGPIINVFGNIASAVGADPVLVDLTGNKLPNSPESSVNLFADYTQMLDNGMSVVFHLDYFWQDEFYTRTFNTDADVVDSWAVSNAAITLYSEDQTWNIKAWVKNLQDDNNITGHYTTDAVSGLFSNVFIMEPRTMGVTFNMSFD